MAYPNYVFTIFAFIGFLMCAIPLRWHFEVWNAGTCLYMIWVGLACLNQFINSIIWNRDAIIRAVVWCDISTKFVTGVNIAIPACSLCITRRLYLISSAKNLAPTKKEKRREVYIDLAIGLGIPTIGMVLHYVVQGHRFDIFAEVGCLPTTHFTPLAIVFVSLPPIIIGLVSMIYGALAFNAFWKSRAYLEKVMTHQKIPSSRYIRHMALACVDMVATVPLATYVLSANIKSVGVSPWLGWADTHSGFSRIDQVPTFVWRDGGLFEHTIELSRWLNVLCAFVFFAFFGFSAEARKNYRSMYNTFAKLTRLPTLSNPIRPIDLLEGEIIESRANKSSKNIQPIIIPGVLDLKRTLTDELPSFSSTTTSTKIPHGALSIPEAVLTRSTVTYQFSPVRRREDSHPCNGSNV